MLATATLLTAMHRAGFAVGTALQQSSLPLAALVGLLEFAYVGLSAGPWQSKSGDYSDTSLGIALRRMTEAKARQAKLGRKVRMVAHLVEKDANKYAEPIEAVKRFPEVETRCYPGVAEHHAAAIAKLIPTGLFAS